MVVTLKEPGNEMEKPRSAKSGMMCPVCDVPLSMSDRQGVEIDFCPQCRGVWLDRGELDKIIERSAAEMAPPPRREPEPRGYDDRGGYSKHGSHGKHGYRGRKSFLRELFD
mgnify:CR=1 FL=1|jgi:hypothetical protein